MINTLQTLADLARSPNTGDSRLQVAIFTNRINSLNEHLKINKKDHSSRLGLLKMVSKRKRLLQYIKNSSNDSYKSLIDLLGIRK